jgi:sulfatase modifying factor 1
MFYFCGQISHACELRKAGSPSIMGRNAWERHRLEKGSLTMFAPLFFSKALRLLVLLALMGFASVEPLAWGQSAGGPASVRKIAFLVGVSDYDKAGFRDLEFAEKDARRLKVTLEKLGFEVIVLLGSEAGGTAATRENIWKQFRADFLPQLKKLNKQDVALFAFAGHGRHHRDENGVEGHYFCPRDANNGDAKTWVSLNELVDDVEKYSGCKNNLFLVDCCRDNFSRGRGADGEGFQLKKDTVAILFASSYGEEAYELPKDYRLPEGHPLAGKETGRSAEHGLFTYFVLEALELELATDREGLVTWDTLVNHVKKWVSRESERLKLGNGSKTQNPNSVGSLRGESPLLAKFVVVPERGTKPPAMERPEAGAMPPAESVTPGSGMGRGAWGVPKGSAPKVELKEGFSSDDLKMASEAWADYLQVRVNERAAAAGEQPLQLRLIPPGEFQMGCAEKEIEAVLKWDPSYPREWLTDAPAHRVRLSRPYFMGMYEVTRGQFSEFVRASGYQTEAESDGKGGYGFKDGKYVQSPEFTWRAPGFEQDDGHPVVEVSWNDAVAYCRWLTEESQRRGELPAGWEYRLPTEAEWEYACRGGSRGWYSFGDEPESLVRHGNVADASYSRSFSNKYRILSGDDGNVYTAPVGSYTPNRYGLFDLHGNVWEWCGDWYDAYPTGSVSDPTGPVQGSYRVSRGGSWNYGAAYCRSANRFGYFPSTRSNCELGFRVALSSREIPK